MLRLLICLRAPWPSFWISKPTPTPGSRGPTSLSEFQIVWSKCHHHPPRFHSAHKSPSLPTPPLTATIFHISFSVSKQKKTYIEKSYKDKNTLRVTLTRNSVILRILSLPFAKEPCIKSQSDSQYPATRPPYTRPRFLLWKTVIPLPTETGMFNVLLWQISFCIHQSN